MICYNYLFLYKIGITILKIKYFLKWHFRVKSLEELKIHLEILYAFLY